MTLHPPIEPHASGLLDTGDGNRIFWDISGNPQGLAAVVLHGGPGSGASAAARRSFDPQAYRIILFDQRGCGRSTPHAGDADADLSSNTTAHLLGDMERLRRHLGVERWLLFGMSWGCTLALAYAQQHPARVTALVLCGTTTTRRREIDWLYRGIAPLFPAEWARFRAGAPAEFRDGDLVAGYRQLLADPDPQVHLRAARDWHAWEAASILVDPAATLSAKWSDPRFLLARARIITHYFHEHAWLDDGVLLHNAPRMAGIPGTMVQGRFDLEAPLTTAWELSQRWPEGELVIVPNAGHAPGSPGMAAALVAATNRYAKHR